MTTYHRAEVDPATHTVRVIRAGMSDVVLTYSGRDDVWTWGGTYPIRITAETAGWVLSDLVPDVRALLREAVATLSPAAQAVALEGL